LQTGRPRIWASEIARSFIADYGFASQRLVTGLHGWRRIEATDLTRICPAKQLDDNLIRRTSQNEQT